MVPGADAQSTTPMTTSDRMDTVAFKQAVKPHLEAAIEANGGLDRIRKLYSAMPGIVDFIAG